MKLNLNLSLTARPAQRCAQSEKAETMVKVPALTPAAGIVRKNSPFDLLAARANKPVRIPTPMIVARPAFRGDKSYLRALREAEMALWNANLKIPTFFALLVVVLNISTK